MAVERHEKYSIHTGRQRDARQKQRWDNTEKETVGRPG